MSIDLQEHHDDAGVCGFCNGETSRTAVERVDAPYGVPMTRSFRLIVACRACGRSSNLPLKPPLRALVSKTPGLTWRLVVTWLWFASLLVGGVGYFAWSQHMEREHARAPLVGDHWTIETQPWADQTGTQLENAAKYGVVTVTGVDDRVVETAMCDTSSDDASTVEKHCRTFRVEGPSVERSAIPKFLDDGAIHRITRDGDHTVTVWEVIAFAIWFGLFVIHGWRSRRFLAKLPIR